ncbi:MAG TPA: glycerophosphodiester phosphodiesterase family protein [Virgibacillus sp.]|nr:glycerophosphodiester phosphodiesterase family protein [Virgibacillus sp.]
MKIKALAHRGYRLKYPENTLSAYKAAYELGFSHLELDVHLSKDGIPVLMHDKTINRMTDGTGLIKDYTLEELKRFRVGKEGNERIPTFAEGLQFAKGKMLVSVELKQMGDLYSGIEEAVLKVLKENEMMDHVYINSFDHFAIMKMRELSDDISLGLIQHGATPAVIPLMKEINARYLSVRVEYLSKEFVKMCDEAGIQIVVWPVNNEDHFAKVKDYPNILCTTDDLETFKEAYERGFVPESE